MKLWHLLTLALLAGCVNSAAVDRPDIVADLACETARMVVQLSQGIAPTPTTDDCERCGGTGILGDRAAIKITCPDCRGTGKKTKSVLCTTGSCKP